MSDETGVLADKNEDPDQESLRLRTLSITDDAEGNRVLEAKDSNGNVVLTTTVEAPEGSRGLGFGVFGASEGDGMAVKGVSQTGDVNGSHEQDILDLVESARNAELDAFVALSSSEQDLTTARRALRVARADLTKAIKKVKKGKLFQSSTNALLIDQILSAAKDLDEDALEAIDEETDFQADSLLALGNANQRKLLGLLALRGWAVEAEDPGERFPRSRGGKKDFIALCKFGE